MMYISSLIHLLEGITVILVGVLLIQVYRCYLNFTKAAEAQEAASKNNALSRSLTLKINISQNASSRIPIESSPKKPVGALPVIDVSENTNEFLEENLADNIEECFESSFASDVSSEKPNVSKRSSQTSQHNTKILNDYIGEFFGESPSLDISDFKNTTPQIEDADEETIQSNVMLKGIDKPDIDEVIVVESTAATEPVILDCDTESANETASPSSFTTPLESNIDEDSVITVVERDSEGSSDDKVMSDKVVHAMLDEARVVCAS